MRHLLEWADETPFPLAHVIESVFPVYLLTARNDGKDTQLSPQGMNRICAEARSFYQQMCVADPERYHSVNITWIETLHPGRENGVQSEVKELKTFPMEDIFTICTLQPRRLIDNRDQAVAAFLFLSGMRIDAFVSLPIHCVDLKAMSVKQFPTLGVRTKNHKTAKTYLYQIPELFGVVQAWDELVRKKMDPDSLWYT